VTSKAALDQPRPSPLRLGFWQGAWFSLLLLLPLTALGYLASRFVAVPFVPYSLFDWLARALPGPLITAGIDTMVNTMRALGLSVADLAKLAEQTLAVVIFTGLLTLAGAIFFASTKKTRASWRAGLLLSLVVGVPLAFVVWRITVSGGAALEPATAGLWTLLFVLAWGTLLTAVQRRLTRPETRSAEVEAGDRRRFMVYLGGAAATITLVTWGGVGAAVGGRRDLETAEAEGERWSANNALPNAGATPEPAPGTRPEYTPLEQYYRIDINLTPPAIQEEGWRLRVEGMVDTPREYTLQELRGYESVHQFITMACISNPVGGELTSTTRWTGVPLRRLLPEWSLQETATHLRISSVDGFFEYLAVDDIESDERIMLAYAWDGVPLRIRNGFPLRVYIPDLYGMKQPKWIESIEAVDAWEPGYWVVRGWDREAQIRTTSVIDTVATVATDESGENLVPVGGIAHAGARGIQSVEVQVDGGEWRQAELRQPLSELSWVVWRYNWPFEAGEHTFAVRCTDGNGVLQTAEVSPPHPSGATGIYSTQARV
jgi:DMSO/TMAO reductase YedYZ molybdopterin-dependent catalytic subunit